ncbi:hypothetical protein [Rhizomonospora bruguierae]|uniref:hypothetical protein n=1 Tax=Rhizomonospora bruguierae TaxID=1581705 RepID=UPI001BCA8F7D|nr:hypothetical protein [Micromonospora sp. NBRC 107566]
MTEQTDDTTPQTDDTPPPPPPPEPDDLPKITIRPGWPRDLIGQLIKDGGSEEPPAPPQTPSRPPYKVYLANLRDAEAQILEAVKWAKQEYDDLAGQFAKDQKWIFTLDEERELYEYHGVWEGKHPSIVLGDTYPERTKDFSDRGNSLLMSAADVIRAAGDFTLALDTAGQIYSKADIDATFPSE